MKLTSAGCVKQIMNTITELGYNTGDIYINYSSLTQKSLNEILVNLKNDGCYDVTIYKQLFKLTVRYTNNTINVYFEPEVNCK